MKKMAVVAVLLFSALALAGSEPNPADYPLSVHVSSSRVNDCGSTSMKVTIDGKKYELGGGTPLALGDYKARAVKFEVRGVQPYDVYGKYQFLLPDNKTRTYIVVGVME